MSQMVANSRFRIQQTSRAIHAPRLGLTMKPKPDGVPHDWT